MKTLKNNLDRDELRNRLLQLTSESPRRWGKMSAHQMVCHLTDSFKAGTGDKAVSSTGNVLHRSVLKWLALYAPLPWPHGVPTRPEMNQDIGGTKPVEFEKDRAELIELIERFSRPQRDFAWHPHPLFGLMADRDWFRWGYLHVDHHLRQFGV
ncbi:MAG TPA: DUF1569 domain-containing protein [Pyrinomonadaceae bacterium]|nr:DUF1569 domain-containing protein [Pyrinomonadaceae bacterium]